MPRFCLCMMRSPARYEDYCPSTIPAVVFCNLSKKPALFDHFGVNQVSRNSYISSYQSGSPESAVTKLSPRQWLMGGVFRYQSSPGHCAVLRLMFFVPNRYLPVDMPDSLVLQAYQSQK